MFITGFRRAGLALASMVALSATAAHAQGMDSVPLGGPASYGSAKIVGGAGAAPYTIPVMAGGTESVASLGEGCAGFVSIAPDFSVVFTAGDEALHFVASSDVDAVLVVQSPDGAFHCSDDSYKSLDPKITIAAPESGTYDIWVGTIAELAYADASLTITEVPGKAGEELPASFGMVGLEESLAAGGAEIALSAGGDIDAATFGESCVGYVATAPDISILADSDVGSWGIAVRSDSDATIAVRLPDGDFICNDDFDGLNPGVRFDASEPGQYDVWVGTFAEQPPAEATLTIGTGTDILGLDWTLDPDHGSIDLAPGEGHEVVVTAGGPVDGSSAEASCWGYVNTAPDFRVYTEALAEELVFSIDAEIDTTLIIADPDGAWFCNDDTNDLNPEIAFTEPLTGTYDIWVGAYHEDESGDATLTISQNGEIMAGGDVLDWGLPPVYGEIDLEASNSFHEVDVTVGGPADASSVGDECWGYTTAASTYRVYYLGGAESITFSAYSTTDTTMIVADPNGNWHCNDDTNDLNPAISFDYPDSGTYDIWVATFDDGVTGDATLEISQGEIFVNEDAELNWSMTPVYGEIDLAAGDTHTLDVELGGTADAATVDNACWGYTTEEPTFRIFYAGGAEHLTFSAYSGTDTTLVVADPDGFWFCNDDTNEFDPEVRFDDPMAGQYDVWVATYDEGATGTAELEIWQGDVVEMPEGELDWSLTPENGEIDLAPGENQTFDVVVGGPADASLVHDSCWGYTTAAPTFRVFFEGGANALAFNAYSETDTTLVVADPNGDWFCNDDTYGVDPEVWFDDPLSGQYDIWVAAFSEGEVGEAIVDITQSDITEQADAELDWSLTPVYGETDLPLDAGEDFNVVAGGPADASTVDTSCWGYTTAEPTYRIYYEGGAGSLTFALHTGPDSDFDTTLIVADPNGDWSCNDDTNGFDPEVSFNLPMPGQYDIWAASFGEGETGEVRFEITQGEEQEIEAEFVLNWDLTPVYGEVDLAVGESDELDVVVGGLASTSSVSDSCWGYTTEEPTYRFYLDEGAGPLRILATSEDDLTLAVADPNGDWFCNDDSVGLNPEVVFDAPMGGQYDVWVATFSEDIFADATLSITQDEAGVETGDQLDWTLDPAFGTVDLSAGFFPDPTSVELTAGGRIDTFDLAPGCAGYVTAEPSVRFYYGAGDYPLYMWVEADRDATLIVSDPNGDWICDDDGAIDPLDPALGWNEPLSGQYDIWVGTYGGAETDATLFISETEDQRQPAEDIVMPPMEEAPPPADEAAPAVEEALPPEEAAVEEVPPPEEAAVEEQANIDPALPPLSGTIEVASGFDPNPLVLDVMAGGDIDTRETIGDGCYGIASAAPTVNIDYSAGGDLLTVTGTADRDTTLLILSPSGEYSCDDDGAGYPNPTIAIDEPEAGVYAVWLATYSGAEASSATLTISAN